MLNLMRREKKMPSATIECEICGGTGWRSSTEGSQRGPVVPCECRERERTTRITEAAGIPRRYENCDFNNFNCAWTGVKNLSLWKALGAAQKYVDDYVPGNQSGLLFLGPPGVGKTHLLVALLRKFCACGYNALFLDYQDLLRRIQNSYNPASRTTEYELLRPVLTTAIVAIDDLGNNRISDWVEDTVTYVVNHRYSQNLPTLFTANLSEQMMSGEPGKRNTDDTFEGRLGMRVGSRLREMCRFVRLEGDDFRRRAGGVQ